MEIIAMFLPLLLGTLLVASSSNPVSGVISLVFTFIAGAVLLWNLGSPFLCLILIMVYVGAIAVLFVFVVMMLPTCSKPTLYDNTTLIPAMLLISSLFMVLGYIWGMGDYSIPVAGLWLCEGFSPSSDLFSYLYVEYMSLLLLSALVLFCALMGSLVLCLCSGGGIASKMTKSQDGFYQVAS